MLKTPMNLPRTTVLLVVLVTGCSSQDERLVQLGQESADRQAEQNRTIAEQSQQVTQTTGDLLDAEVQSRQEMIQLQRALADADAAAREELIRMQQDLVARDTDGRSELNELQRETRLAVQTERQTLDQHRADLEDERRQIAKDRTRAPLVAAAITQVGMVLACLLPLVLCGYLLYVLRSSGDHDGAVMELLVEEISSDRPRLLPSAGLMPRIERRTDAGSDGESSGQTQPRGY